MVREIQTKDLKWIDIVNITKEEISLLENEFHFHKADLNELTKKSSRPKLSEYADYLFMVLHSPYFNEKTRTTSPVEVDVFVTQNCVVTVHIGRVHILDDFFQQVSKNENLRDRYVGRSSAYLLYSIMLTMIDSSLPKIDHIYEKIENAEKKIFDGHERAMVFELAALNRDVFGFRQIIGPQAHLYQAGILNGEFSSPAFKTVFKNIESHLKHVWNLLENLQEKLEALSVTNSNLLSHKLNEFIKVLTVISAIFIPIAIIAQVVPYLNNATETRQVIFWVLIGTMILIDLSILFYYRLRNLI